MENAAELVTVKRSFQMPDGYRTLEIALPLGSTKGDIERALTQAMWTLERLETRMYNAPTPDAPSVVEPELELNETPMAARVPVPSRAMPTGEKQYPKKEPGDEGIPFPMDGDPPIAKGTKIRDLPELYLRSVADKNRDGWFTKAVIAYLAELDGDDNE